MAQMAKKDHVIELSANQKKNNNYMCSFCRQQGFKRTAMYRTRYEADHKTGYACPEHKYLLPDNDPDMSKQKYYHERILKQRRDNPKHDEHLTEADYQTWYNL